MSTPFIGQILCFGGNFAPVGFALCNGQQQSIDQNTALYALVGTTYGGDGITTFNLPDLRGRTPIHQGQSAGLSNYVLGQVGGVESVSLSQSQVPSHTHSVMASTSNSTSQDPGNAALLYLAAGHDGEVTNPIQIPKIYVPWTNGMPTVNLAAEHVTSTGGSLPIDVMQPFLAISFLIALQGIFPSRN